MRKKKPSKGARPSGGSLLTAMSEYLKFMAVLETLTVECDPDQKDLFQCVDTPAQCGNLQSSTQKQESEQ